MELRRTRDARPADARLARAPRAAMEPLECRQLLSTSVALCQTTAPALITAASATGYTPQQVRQAYGFDQVVLPVDGIAPTGAGQTIAIVDAYSSPRLGADLHTFDTQFGLPDPPSLTQVNQSGGSALPAANVQWAAEISLDVEWAHAIAPGANLVLVEAASGSLSDLLAAVDTARNMPGVTSVSMSWGSSEFPAQVQYDSAFTTPANHEGVTFVASSGDTGATQGLQWPAASSNVLSVGGTSLSISGSDYQAETAWQGGTSGVSLYESEPDYQADFQSTGRRMVPDVAYSADSLHGFSVFDSTADGGRQGWQIVGGTSAGAPQWAGLVALADQGRALRGGQSLDGPTEAIPAIYGLQATRSDAAFNDIAPSSSQGASVTTAAGYSPTTGLGTPRAGVLIQTLAGKDDHKARPAIERAGGVPLPATAPAATPATPSAPTPVSASVPFIALPHPSAAAFVSAAPASTSVTAVIASLDRSGRQVAQPAEQPVRGVVARRTSIWSTASSTAASVTYSALPTALKLVSNELRAVATTGANAITYLLAHAPPVLTAQTALAEDVGIAVSRPVAAAGRAVVNLFHVNALATFSDTMGAFIEESAGLAKPRPFRHTRAWLITGAVAAADVAMIAYWYSGRAAEGEEAKAASQRRLPFATGTPIRRGRVVMR